MKIISDAFESLPGLLWRRVPGKTSLAGTAKEDHVRCVAICRRLLNR